MRLHLLSACLCLVCAFKSNAQATPDFSARAAQIESRLQTQWLPYWSQTLDARGGYSLVDEGLKPRGQGYGAGEKSVITQARMVWMFARAHRAHLSSTKANHLQSARHGARFLRDVLRDKQFGGYYFSVDETGRVKNARKSTYAQAFVVYGLTEFARASGESEPRALALQAWRTMRERARDARHGGYLEHFTREWKPILAPEPGAAPEVPGLKSANCTLHLMEAGAELVALTGDQSVKADLQELTRRVETDFYPANASQSVSLFNRDWTRAGREENNSFSFGHIIEAAHLIVRAREVLGWPADWNGFHARVDETLRAGYDHARGGMWTSGRFDTIERTDHKWWWVQYETLAALVMATKRPGGEKYASALGSLLDWIDHFATDKRDFVACEATDGAGKIVTHSKAHPWKAAYHDGRALIDFVDAF